MSETPNRSIAEDTLKRMDRWCAGGSCTGASISPSPISPG
jgi:hypothetical protein